MSETCRVSWQNENFGYLMHLVGYLYEAYHDARSLEHKVRQCQSGGNVVHNITKSTKFPIQRSRRNMRLPKACFTLCSWSSSPLRVGPIFSTVFQQDGDTSDLIQGTVRSWKHLDIVREYFSLDVSGPWADSDRNVSLSVVGIGLHSSSSGEG
jgi:hypothetical protein